MNFLHIENAPLPNNIPNACHEDNASALKEATVCAIPTASENRARNTLRPPKMMTPYKV